MDALTAGGRDRFRAITVYVRATHAVLAAASAVAPVIALLLVPPPVVTSVAVVVLGAIVATGGAVLASPGFAPAGPLVRAFASGPRRAALGVLVVAAAVSLVVVLPETGGQVSLAAAPMAWALRAICDGSFWSGIVRVAGATALAGLVVALVAAAAGTGWNPLTLGVAALLALGVLGQDAIYLLAIELDDLRELEAERAVRTERKRFAGDLHDIQGQHLGLIAVEAVIVGRLIAAGRTDEAARHAARVQEVATAALDELHRVVHAYREVSLDAEIANAARVLEAAGIAADARAGEPAALPASHDRLLGLTVREAVTNVLKHTRAESCRIETGPTERDGRRGVRLTVVDSGPSAAVPTPGPAGTGLAALRERFAGLGGRLDFSASETGATLDAWLPIPEGPPS